MSMDMAGEGRRVRVNVGGRHFETTTRTAKLLLSDSDIIDESALVETTTRTAKLLLSDSDIIDESALVETTTRTAKLLLSDSDIIDESALVETTTRTAKLLLSDSDIIDESALVETTTRTATLLLSDSDIIDEIFVDRDPSLFSHLLSLLRSPHSIPPPPPIHQQQQHLIREASLYGLPLLSRLRSALAPPPLLGYDASLAATLLPASDPFVTALSPAPDGSVFLAHAGLISSYDSALSYSSTVCTHLDRITSLSRLSSPHSQQPLPLPVAVAGSLHHPGLHLYDLTRGAHLGSVLWSDPSDTRLYKSWVTAIAPPSSSSSSPLFASFEAAHRENCILCVDPETLQVTGEIGRQSGIAAKSAAAGRVVHLPQLGGAVFMSSVSAGAFGYSGYMRLWDPRSRDAVWETSEPGGRSRNSSRFGDSFADVDVDGEQLALYKVCWKSGDVGVADLRKLGDDPWIYLSDSDGAAGAGGGVSNSVHCYKGQVFVGRQSGLEVWSQLDHKKAESDATAAAGQGGSSWRRNWVDGEEEAGRGVVRRMEAGGDRLFLCRQGLEGIQADVDSQVIGRKDMSKSAIDIWKEVFHRKKSKCVRNSVDGQVGRGDDTTQHLYSLISSRPDAWICWEPLIFPDLLCFQNPVDVNPFLIAVSMSHLIAHVEKPNIEWPKSFQRCRAMLVEKQETLKTWQRRIAPSISRHLSIESFVEDFCASIFTYYYTTKSEASGIEFAIREGEG